MNASNFETIYPVPAPSVSTIVEVEGVAYFVKLECRRFAEVHRSTVSVCFDTSLGRAMCQRVGVVTCPRCMAASLWQRGDFGSLLRCWRCRRTFRP